VPASDALVDDLALEIAGPFAKHPGLLDCARCLSQAEQELDRVRRYCIRLIEDTHLSWGQDQEGPCCKAKKPRAEQVGVEISESALASQPWQAGDAIRRALPDLAKCMRYERRAAAARDKALKELLSVMRQLNNNDQMLTQSQLS
jgi:hypothetical protein